MLSASAKLKALYAWSNHGWPTICLQTAGGLLLAFGLICVLGVQSDVFGFGAIFAFVQHLVPSSSLPAVGWSSIAVAVLLGLLTLPAQRKHFARFKREQSMLQRQDWRK